MPIGSGLALEHTCSFHKAWVSHHPLLNHNSSHGVCFSGQLLHHQQQQQTATTQMTCPLHKAWGHWFLATPCLSLPSVYMFFFSLKEGLKGQRLHRHEYLSLGTELSPRRRSLKRQARAGDEVHRPCLPTINIALGSTPSTTEQHGATARGSQHCVTSGCETCLPVWSGQHFLQ